MGVNSPYRLAAIDLDGTLLDPHHRVSPRSKEAVRQMSEAGITCVLASGRMHESILPHAHELHLSSPVISYNGAVVRYPSGTQDLRHMRLHPRHSDQVLEFCIEQGHHLNFYVDHRLMLGDLGEWALFYLRQTGSPYMLAESFSHLRGRSPTKLIIIDRPDTISTLLPYWRSRLGSEVAVARTNPEYLEFMQFGVSKAAALEQVCTLLQIPRSQTVAFGDADNDAEMLAWAGLGVVMGNGTSAAKEAADVSTGTNAEDGFAGAVCRYVLA